MSRDEERARVSAAQSAALATLVAAAPPVPTPAEVMEANAELERFRATLRAAKVAFDDVMTVRRVSAVATATIDGMGEMLNMMIERVFEAECHIEPFVIACEQAQLAVEDAIYRDEQVAADRAEYLRDEAAELRAGVRADQDRIFGVVA